MAKQVGLGDNRDANKLIRAVMGPERSGEVTEEDAEQSPTVEEVAAIVRILPRRALARLPRPSALRWQVARRPASTATPRSTYSTASRSPIEALLFLVEKALWHAVDGGPPPPAGARRQ
jgi:hypothetical protein